MAKLKLHMAKMISKEKYAPFQYSLYTLAVLNHRSAKQDFANVLLTMNNSTKYTSSSSSYFCARKSVQARRTDPVSYSATTKGKKPTQTKRRAAAQNFS